MEHKFKIGDKVKLLKNSEYYGQAPKLEGEIIEIRTEGYSYRIRWSDGSKNSYRNKDIELVQDKSEFKEGDYVVVLQEDTRQMSARRLINHCFKLLTSKSNMGNINCYVTKKFDFANSNDNGYHICPNVVRHATPEEIKEYDRLGTPYDVTTLKQVNEVLISTDMAQEKACNTCKYTGNCKKAPHNISGNINCTATNGQHYPKDVVNKEFVLPEKWHVKVTKDNQKILSNWRFIDSYDALSIGQITGVCNSNGEKGHNPALHVKGTDFDFGEEITFNQFKQYVLKETVKEPEFKVGDWVVFLADEAKGTSYFTKVWNKNHILCINRILSTSLDFNKEQHPYRNACSFSNNIKYFRKATQAEIDSVTKEKVPEYVECIVDQRKQYNVYGELGKIYKVENWQYSSSDCLLKGTTSGSTDKTRFKPSTKEAYDKQHQPKGFDRNFHVVINTQKEADLMFEYFKSKDEKISSIRTYNNKYLQYNSYWYLGALELTNTPEKSIHEFVDVRNPSKAPEGYAVGEVSIQYGDGNTGISGITNYKSQRQQGVAMDVSCREFGNMVEKELLKPYSKSRDSGFQEPIIRKKVNKVNKLKIVNI